MFKIKLNFLPEDIMQSIFFVNIFRKIKLLIKKINNS